MKRSCYNLKMATSYSLEEILERQCMELQDLKTATIFIKSKSAIKEQLLNMQKHVLQMQDGINVLKKMLDELKEQNNECSELLLLIKALDKKILHMQDNVPPRLIYDCPNSDTSIVMNAITTITESDVEETPVKDCRKILFNEPEICPTIPLISEEEFNKLPKYIIGRQSIETLNNFIQTINQVVKAKYTFLSQGKAQATKQGYLNLYLHYKKQEFDVCTNNEYVYFFTREDYQKYAQSKLDKIKLNLITALRHCKRLREYRIKNDVHYIVV